MNGSTKNQPPLFLGSSCAHTTSSRLVKRFKRSTIGSEGNG